MKKLRYTITLIKDVPKQENYNGVSEDEAKEAGVELPIDTPEKARAMEAFFLKEGYMSVDEVLDGDEQVTVEVIEHDNFMDGIAILKAKVHAKESHEADPNVPPLAAWSEATFQGGE